MAAVIANPIWGVTARQSVIQLRTDYPPLADFYYKHFYRFHPPIGPATLRFGRSDLMNWAYQMIGYTPVQPDPLGGGAYRPTVGQLTP